MKVSFKNVGTCRKTMTVEVPSESIIEEHAELLKYYAKSVAIPGFRKGKAPKALVEKKFSKEMNADLKDRLVPKYYHDAIEAEGVKVVSIIDVSEPVLVEGQPLTFDVTMDVPPEFKLPKYQGITIKAEKVDVTDKQVEETIESIRRQHATHEDVEGRPAKEKDMVQVSYESSIDGEQLEVKVPEARGMGKGNGYWVTCDDESFIPGMGKELIGTSIGDKKEIDVEFPAEYIVPELAGKKAVFKVEATGMRESKLPEFDEEFLKKLHVESEEELRTNVRQHLTEAAENAEKRRQEDTVCEFLLKKTKLDVPETAVQEQTRTLMYEMARQRMMQGMTQDQVSAQSAEMMEEAKVKAEEQVKLRYIIMSIASAENLDASDEEVDEEITKLA
ncbi:MAG: trigger factor, partial [Kiritimatiellaceae bacterium]|nr:trigger factor [Kiritimatiellaceae bacterium]